MAGSAVESRWNLAATALLVLIFVACGSDKGRPPEGLGPSADTRPTPEPVASPAPLDEPDVVLRVSTKKGIRFDQKVLKAPAGVVAKLVYTNRSGLPHNVNIVGGSAFQDPVLAGTRTITDVEPVSDVFQVPDQPGKYLFFCRVLGHGPKMQGFLVVK